MKFRVYDKRHFDTGDRCAEVVEASGWRDAAKQVAKMWFNDEPETMEMVVEDENGIRKLAQVDADVEVRYSVIVYDDLPPASTDAKEDA